MSQLCLIGIENVSQDNREKYFNLIMEKVKNYEWGVITDINIIRLKYREIIDSFKGKQMMFYCLSDSEKLSTCEEIFCPDWCNINEQRRRSFRDNLNIFQEIVSINYNFGNIVHIFLGMDLGLYDDYLVEYCQISKLAQTILLKTEEEGFVPDIHIIIKPKT